MKRIILISFLNILVLLISVLLIKNCSLKTINVDKKKPTVDNSPLVIYANKFFWENFHQGNYNQLEQVIKLLTAAYLQSPNHLETISHLGFAHLWFLSERGDYQKLLQRLLIMQPCL